MLTEQPLYSTNTRGLEMSDTPEWYVTEYPVEGSFAITDGYEIFAQIIGGKTVGDECDLANRIAKLPDLERERDEARAELSLKCQSLTIASGTISDLLKKIERLEKQIEKVRRERDEAREQINEEVRDYELELRKLCEAYNDLAERNAKLKAYFIQKSDSAERERDEAKEQNAKLRDIAERALNFGEYRAPYLGYPGPTWEKLRAELDQIKEEVK